MRGYGAVSGAALTFFFCIALFRYFCGSMARMLGRLKARTPAAALEIEGFAWPGLFFCWEPFLPFCPLFFFE